MSNPSHSDDLSENTLVVSQVLSGLGALGVALQNYQGVELFINGLVKTRAPMMTVFGPPLAFLSGGVCSGIVNFWMNEKLLKGFFTRMLSDEDYFFKSLTAWQKLEYFSGIFVFIVTGILFGLMAFAFTMEGPLAILSVAAGLFVSIIMTIQEIETWLGSYTLAQQEDQLELSSMQQFGKFCGHVIAVGNVLALSTLFTLGLAESLIALSFAPLFALQLGLTTAFTFGAFTEYYFYNFYLANFCKDLDLNIQLMMETKHPYLGLLCVSINAFVNGALTYSGVELLTALLLSAGIGVPSLSLITGLALVSAIFAGSASMVLGMDFWIGEKPKPPFSDSSLLPSDSSSNSPSDSSPFPSVGSVSMFKLSPSPGFGTPIDGAIDNLDMKPTAVPG